LHWTCTVVTVVTQAACMSMVSSCAKAPPTTGGDGSGGNPAGTDATGGSGTLGSGGQTGSGGSGSGGSLVMKDPSNYPQNTPGARYPYPQGHAFANCTFPLYNTDSIAASYNNWKTKFYVGGRVVRPEMNNDTVSEGIAYGMLVGVYMNDRPMFDTLWTYAQSHFDGNGLMNWNIGSNGSAIGQGSATDADEDMAWALLMASVQWANPGYNTAAVTLINNLWDHGVDTGGGNVLKPGDNFGGAGQTNPSYFAPSYYRVFARVTPNHDWMAVVTSSYNIIGAASGTYGLVPNWVNSSGTGVNGPNNDTAGPYFGYDACRTPWRIALDYCENGTPQAKAYLDKLVGFYQQQAPTTVGTLKDGYTTAAGNPPGVLGDYAAGIAFFGPGGVAAMGGGHEQFAALVYKTLVSNTTTGLMNIAGVYTYFHASWGILSLLAMSGNFWTMM
jgi:endo-1,4-beta-D-glucanase Y